RKPLSSIAPPKSGTARAAESTARAARADVAAGRPVTAISMDRMSGASEIPRPARGAGANPHGFAYKAGILLTVLDLRILPATSWARRWPAHRRLCAWH